MSQNTTPNSQNEMKDNLLIPLEMNATNEPNIGGKQKYSIKSFPTTLAILICFSSPFYLIIIYMTSISELQIYLKIVNKRC